MMSADLLATIGRLRRAMPRNADVLAVCDGLEQHLTGQNFAEPMQQAGRSVQSECPGFDRLAYQRKYMRKRRAAKGGAV
jgi:hypothetical protein